MKKVLAIVGVLFLVVAIIYVIGLFLPEKHTASQSRSLNASPETAWATITNIDRFKEWRKGLDDVRPTGANTYVEVSHGDEVEYRMHIVEPNRSFTSTIITKDLPYGGRWTFILEPEGSGSKLTITEEGEVYNPIFRFMSKFVFGHDATMIEYLDDLSVML